MSRIHHFFGSCSRFFLRPPTRLCSPQYSRHSGMALQVRGFGTATPNTKVSRLLKTAGVLSVGIVVAEFSKPTVYCHCDAPRGHKQPILPSNLSTTTSPASTVDLYKLSFGTVCGIFAGVFIKKGARVVALFVGGIFVLLQYFSSLSLIRVEWGRVGSRLEYLFSMKEPDGSKKALTVSSLWNRIVNLLTVDFQRRAAFVVGLALGLRLG